MTTSREDLDALVARGCAIPGCDHAAHVAGPLFLHARCHPSAGLSAAYTFGEGVLVLRCRKCERLVMKIAVASR